MSNVINIGRDADEEEYDGPHDGDFVYTAGTAQVGEFTIGAGYRYPAGPAGRVALGRPGVGCMEMTRSEAYTVGAVLMGLGGAVDA